MLHRSRTCQTCSCEFTIKRSLLMVVSLLMLTVHLGKLLGVITCCISQSPHCNISTPTKQSTQQSTATGVLARSSCEELQSALVVNCILEVQPAGLGAVQRLLACHCMRYRTLCSCCTCAATADLQSHMNAVRDIAARRLELPGCSPQLSSLIFELYRVGCMSTSDCWSRAVSRKHHPHQRSSNC